MATMSNFPLRHQNVSDMSDMSTFFGTPALRVKVLLGARKTAGSRAIVACCACLFAKRFLPLVTMFLNKI
jgi:hypothetical protein